MTAQNFSRSFAVNGYTRLFRCISQLLGMLLWGSSLLIGQVDHNFLRGMTWRLVGPFRGGRVLAVTGIPGSLNTYYFGAVAGGVWKTTDAGLTWNPLFDKQPVSSIGAIAVSKSDPNVVYAGTGEACIRGDISFGDGVYKSTDAGKTWKNVGLKDTRQIGRVIVHPSTPDIVFVAALGHAHGPNTERGVFRSTDGGKTWEKVLYKDDKTGAIDVVFDPHNPRILYAALWQAQRSPWGLVSGGTGSGLYKSTDDGTSWQRLEKGLPEGPLGRIGVSVTGADSDRIYAIVEAKNGGLFRSEDAGQSWARINGDYSVRGRPWYYSHVFADPKNADVVYVLDFGFHRSIDGGKSFKQISAQHGDYHDLWIDPTDPNNMINGNDGGGTISHDGSKSWSSELNQPTSQFYHVATDNRFDYHLYGSQQDWGTIAIASRTNGNGIDRPDWYSVGGGESGYILPDPKDPDIVYAGANYAIFTRFNKRNGQSPVVSPWPDQLLSQAAADAKYRFGWTPPMQFSPHDPTVLYVAAQVVFKTQDGGNSWTVISPDLTRNDKSKQTSSGGPITKDNTGVEYYDQVSTLSESSLQKDLIWAGTDDGLIQLTRDGGKNWSNVTPKQMPEWAMVSLIEPSPHDPGTAYAAVERHRLDDFRPYVFRTTDYGKTWTMIANGFPDTAYVHAVREDPMRKGLLYAGTETGIYVSFDDGSHWQSLQQNLPTAPIYDLVVHGDDLAVATHGRSFWILDDISPLRQLNEQVMKTDAYLYKPALAYRTASARGHSVPSPTVGQNAPSGAIIDYYLRSPQKEITLEVLDARGQLVRRYSPAKEGTEESSFRAAESLRTGAGTNRFIWDLRHEAIRPPEGTDEDFGYSEGPTAVPGNYQLRLTVAGKTYTQPLEVKLDPRVEVSQADLQKQFDFAMGIQELMTRMSTTISQTGDLRSQLVAIRKRVKPESKNVLTSLDQLDKELAAVQSGITGWKVKPTEYSLNFPPALDDRLGWMMNHLSYGDGAPNRPMYELFGQLSNQIETELARYRDITSKDLVDFAELLKKENIMAISIPKFPEKHTTKAQPGK
jgi:photosystem II stability/assembly factor-like uncharacterized protein